MQNVNAKMQNGTTEYTYCVKFENTDCQLKFLKNLAMLFC